MPEVPDHLLERSRARRAALGLGGDEAAPAAEAATSTAVEAAPSSAAAPAAAASVAVEAAPKPEKPIPHWVAASRRRKRVPVWAMPVVAFLPIWGVLYAQTLSPPPRTEPTQLEEGKTVYAKCSQCHGAGGGGGSGRKFSEGDLLKTFPDSKKPGAYEGLLGQIEFVNIGTVGVGTGVAYGDVEREGGGHKGGSFNGNNMPPWHESLTPFEVLSVVRYEREVLSGEKIESSQLGAEDELLWPNGSPLINASGAIVDADGKPLFDDKGKLLVRPSYEGGGAASGSGETAAG